MTWTLDFLSCACGLRLCCRCIVYIFVLALPARCSDLTKEPTQRTHVPVLKHMSLIAPTFRFGARSPAAQKQKVGRYQAPQ